MCELLDNKIDRLVLEFPDLIVFTEKGRLEFPNRLPFCSGDNDLDCSDCVFWIIYTHLRHTGNLEEGNHVAIGGCHKVIPNFTFPTLYCGIDNYKEDYYKEKILPVLFKLYDPVVRKELWMLALKKKKKS